jgi:hypothetical protein
MKLPLYKGRISYSVQYKERMMFNKGCDQDCKTSGGSTCLLGWLYSSPYNRNKWAVWGEMKLLRFQPVLLQKLRLAFEVCFWRMTKYLKHE